MATTTLIDRTILQGSGVERPVDSLPQPMRLFLWEVEARGRAPETIAFYEKQLGPFARMVNVDDWLTLAPREQRGTLLQWLSDRRKDRNPRTGEPVTPATVAASWRAVRAWVKWLVAQDYISKDPTETIPSPDLGWTPKETYTKDNIRQMLKLCPPNRKWGARDRVIVCLAVFCGIRRKEIANLDVTDLLMGQNLISLKRTKNRKQRVVDIHPQLRSALTAYLMKYRTDKSPALLQTKDGERMTPDAVGQVWSDLCRRVGITGRKGAHRARHTFVTESLRSGAGLNDVSKAAGHSSIAVTTLYAGTIESQEAAQRLRKVGAMKDWG